jgi:rhamnosyl/mannosyltransferase
MALSMPIAPSFPRVLRRMRKAFDVVHVHAPFPAAMFAGWRDTPGAPPLIIHYHCDVSKPIQRAILRMLSPWNTQMFRSASRIIVTSENLLRHSSILSGFADKCTVIPLPAHLSSAHFLPPDQKAEARRELGLGVDDKIVLFVGRLVPYKGITHLIEAMRSVRGKLLVVGDGPLRSRVERQIVSLNLSRRVQLLGKVSNAALQTLYEIADVFVLPSVDKAEAFGLVQLEAMMHGCPVINTDLPTGVPTVGIHGKTGLTVPPRDSHALASAINAMLADDSTRRIYGTNARTHVRNFDRALIHRKIREVYLETRSARTDVAGRAA